MRIITDILTLAIAPVIVVLRSKVFHFFVCTNTCQVGCLVDSSFAFALLMFEEGFA